METNDLRKTFFSVFGIIPLALVHLIPSAQAYDSVEAFLVREDMRGFERTHSCGETVDAYNGAARKARPYWWYGKMALEYFFPMCLFVLMLCGYLLIFPFRWAWEKFCEWDEKPMVEAMKKERWKP